MTPRRCGRVMSCRYGAICDQPQVGPAALSIVLGSRLRKLRQESNISRVDAAKAIRAHDAKITRMELGQVGFKKRDVADLLTLYRMLDERERAEYFDLALADSLPGWWRSIAMCWRPGSNHTSAWRRQPR